MPFYEYRCTNPKCKKPTFEEMFGLSEDSATTQCPTCHATAQKTFTGFPSVSGVSRGMGRFQFHIDRPRPLEECKRDAKALEESGKMELPEKRMLQARIAGLQAEQDRGTLDNSVDYQVDGHPLEVDDD